MWLSQFFHRHKWVCLKKEGGAGPGSNMRVGRVM